MDASAEAGIRAVRTPTPGVDPVYVSGLVDLILERTTGTPASQRPHETDLGPWHTVRFRGTAHTGAGSPPIHRIDPCAFTSRPTTPASSSRRSFSITSP